MVPSRAPATSPAGSAAAATSSGASSPGTLSGGIDGTWNVDTSVGSFSDFGDSLVGYRVQEQLASIGGNTAVGRTPAVSGSLTIAGTKVTATIQADLTGLQSDDNRRDGQLSHQGLETSTIPTATFTLTSPIDLGSVPADGVEASVSATGTLTLHGQTKDVQIPLKAKLATRSPSPGARDHVRRLRDQQAELVRGSVDRRYRHARAPAVLHEGLAQNPGRRPCGDRQTASARASANWLLYSSR